MRMTQKMVHRLSIVATMATIVLFVPSVVLYPYVAATARAAGRGALLPSDTWPGFGLVALTFAVTGMVILRHGSNPVGWVMHAIGLCFAGQSGQMLYILDGVGRDVGVVGRLLATWTGFGWAPALILMTVVLPLLFPTGRPPNSRWWWVAGIGGIALVYGFVSVTWDTLTGPLDDVAGGWPVLPPLIVAGAVGAIASVVVRYRRADDVERHQLKWVSTALVIVCTAVALALTPPIGDLMADQALLQLLLIATWCTIPVSVAVAITRHRLYDIDRIVSRTVSYALVGLIVSAVYAGLVLILGATLGPRSDVAVAAATLAAAAVFSPVRRRIQNAADRRFNRPRYHAQQELVTFAQHLRGQTQLTTVSDDLIQVVDRTLQPSSVVLWTRNAR
jgi:hypothetical protein